VGFQALFPLNLGGAVSPVNQQTGLRRHNLSQTDGRLPHPRKSLPKWHAAAGWQCPGFKALNRQLS